MKYPIIYYQITQNQSSQITVDRFSFRALVASKTEKGPTVSLSLWARDTCCHHLCFLL